MRLLSPLLIALSLAVATPAWAQNRNGPMLPLNGRALPLSAEAVLLLDAQGKVLFAKNASEDHAPASLVKLMTLYLACEALDGGRVQWEDAVVISSRAAQTPRYRMGLRAGESVPLRVLLEGVAIASANDAATAVAEYVGGTEENFVAQMNAKAQELGLVATHFANAHGLPDPTGRSTAEDLAKLIGRLLQDYPTSRALLGGATFVYRGRVYSRNIPLFHDPGGVQALKTGFTREAGYNLAVAAWRSGESFLLIVLGAHTRSLSFRDARALLEYGFQETGIERPAEPPKRPAAPSRRPADRRSRTAAPATRATPPPSS
ncbi:MAG TPA: D-alanyl-D-alanine carboxypeptidase family protein [Candidatus Methylomirabilis sp.]|nr:D-alanyl-D-alanine carboxypeptidase family protein [Candidatus Methylomirabilis sp.]